MACFEGEWVGETRTPARSALQPVNKCWMVMERVVGENRRMGLCWMGLCWEQVFWFRSSMFFNAGYPKQVSQPFKQAANVSNEQHWSKLSLMNLYAFRRRREDAICSSSTGAVSIYSTNWPEPAQCHAEETGHFM